MKATEVRDAILQLTGREAKLLLLHMVMKLDLAKDGARSQEELYNELLDHGHALIAARSGSKRWEPDDGCTAVHIAFGESFAGSLKQALKSLSRENTDKIVAFRDLYSIGPLWQLHEDHGRQHRREWLRDHINDGDDEDDGEKTDQQLLRHLSQIPPQAKIYVWAGGNAHEQAGLRLAAYLLREHPNEIATLDAPAVCERLFDGAQTRFAYLHSEEIPPDKLQAVLHECKEVPSLSDRERTALEREWLELAERREVLRIYQDGRIVQVGADYFDGYLRNIVEQLHKDRGNRDFIKAARVIGQAIGYCDQYIGDGYFEYRLRELIYSGYLEIKGVPRAMRHYSVRTKAET
ncbi:DUF1835 domain-containing protein [Cohnella laeviribosi]|uniref:DUF1835 domain-containing protein n=1 Tax=Cohnella laeviribosi TaxID=380174 RepID=UPI003D23EB83